MNFWETEVKKDFVFDEAKQKLIDNLDFLLQMSVEEHTLYKKWIGLQKPSVIRDKAQMSTYYDWQWKPTDIHNKELTIKEIEELDPYVEIVEDTKQAKKWTYLRKMISTLSWTANPGRNVKIFIKDRKSDKLLGLASLASDVTSMAVRDNYIGWTKEDKFKKGKLNHTSIASTIVCTQPLGYNFLGGKLTAMMTTLPEIREYWKKKYGDVLVAVGTTSLYGIHSQYNGMPHFKTLGESSGKTLIKPDDSIYEPWHHHVKKTYPEWYSENIEGGKSSPKQRVLAKIFKECGISVTKYHHGYKRGVYFAQMYENGNEFLRSEINESELIIKQKFAEGQEYINNWWKKKAIKRYSKLYDEGRIKDEHLYYIDGIGISWDKFRKNRLDQVGR